MGAFSIKLFLRTVLAIAFLVTAGTSHAACTTRTDPRLQGFNRLMLTRPEAAARSVEAQLQSNDAADTAFRAELYIALADAYAAQEKHAETQRAVESGFKLVTDRRSTAYLNLVYLDSLSPKTEAEIQASRTRAESLIAELPEGSPMQACALVALGLLEHYADRPDQASMHLTRAYRMSESPGAEQIHTLAASVLSVVLRALHDEPSALKLNQEAIVAFARRGATFDLATAYFLRGYLFTEMNAHRDALDVLARSRALSVELEDEIGTAYSDLLICTNELGLRQLSQARTRCGRSLAVFDQAGIEDPAKQALLVLAEIDLAEGQPADALKKLDRVLSQDGRDMVPFRVAHAFELRGQANRALRNYQAALADADNYLQRFKASKEDERAREAAAMRARFQTDREKERNEFLQREITVRNERIAAQEARLRWVIAASFTGAGGILLLGLLLAANRKKKRLLIRLATEDDLTGLANRRYTLRKATAAFESIRDRGAPLTLAVLDIDHFKRVNDEFGHATGDYVLREFARIARTSVRGSDLLGRWGGEEFLLVMPDTPLDVALGAVERMRQAASRVQGAPLPAGYRLTVSAGLASDDGRFRSLEELIAEADGALYAAKEGGRDRSHVAQPSFDASPTNVRRNLSDARQSVPS